MAVLSPQWGAGHESHDRRILRLRRWSFNRRRLRARFYLRFDIGGGYGIDFNRGQNLLEAMKYFIAVDGFHGGGRCGCAIEFSGCDFQRELVTGAALEDVVIL